MYPDPNKSHRNHKHGFCSDGCPVTLKRFKNEGPGNSQDLHPPPYPQPDGIFFEGEIFRPAQFIQTVNDVYQRVVLGDGNSLTSDPIPIEYQTFIRMLQARTIRLPNGQHMFRLYPGLRSEPPASSDLIAEHEGARYLRMPMITDEEPSPGETDSP